MADRVNITVNTEDLKQLYSKYGESLTNKAVSVVRKYTNKIANEAKQIIDEHDYRDTGRLINSIKPTVRAYGEKVTGRIAAGTKYARFIHEGAKHQGDEIVPFFVPFKTAPSLWKWALRNKAVIRKGDEYRLAKNNQVVKPDKGGLMVKIKPAKYFEKPYEKYKDKFIVECKNLINEV